MNSKLLVAGLLGGVILFVLGGVFYVYLLADFFASPLNRAEPLILYIVLGEFTGGFFLAWVLSRFGTSTMAAGARDGAIFGFILALGFAFIMYGAYSIVDLTAHLSDSIIGAIRYGAAGAAIGWWLGRGAS